MIFLDCQMDNFLRADTDHRGAGGILRIENHMIIESGGLFQAYPVDTKDDFHFKYFVIINPRL